ncbi:MAG: AraC family transcriptional regulator [Bacteroidota bacterium]
MLREYQDAKAYQQSALEAYFRLLLVELRRKYNHIHSPTMPSPYLGQLDQFLTLLEGHLREHKGVADYAALLNISSYQLNQITKKHLGKTCSAVINEQLVLEAKRHLLATDYQIKEIAYNLGYTDVSYFTRFFKKQVGQTPLEFRSNFK